MLLYQTMTQSSNTAKAYLVEVVADHAGRRIDNFLMSLLPDLPRSRIYRMLRKGEVRVNRGRTRQDYRLQAGDMVRVPPVTRQDRPPVCPHPEALSRLEAAIIYQDEVLLALDKPSGMAVHGGTGLRWGVIEALRQQRQGQDDYLELVHRLDLETSGCLLLAKTPPALRALHRQLREDRMEKSYLALLCGHLDVSGEVVVEQPLARGSAGGERIMTIRDNGKPARTRFRVLKNFTLATLVEAIPETGRTHQIRVHARHLGHPLAGDRKYGSRAGNDALRAFGLRRLALHAASLHLHHPVTGEELFLDTPLSGDLRAVIDRLEREAEEGH